MDLATAAVPACLLTAVGYSRASLYVPSRCCWNPVPAFHTGELKPQLAILGGMYDALTSFLQEFSSRSPLLWALLVMAVVGGTALGLYTLWELVLRWVVSVWGRGRARANGRG